MKRIKLLIILLSVLFTCNAENYMISNRGMDFIKQYEKCHLKAYPDANGYSIGYGHHGPDVYEGMTITQEQADEYFKKDIQKFTKAVKRLIEALPYSYKFSQGFIDGL